VDYIIARQQTWGNAGSYVGIFPDGRMPPETFDYWGKLGPQALVITDPNDYTEYGCGNEFRWSTHGGEFALEDWYNHFGDSKVINSIKRHVLCCSGYGPRTGPRPRARWFPVFRGAAAGWRESKDPRFKRIILTGSNEFGGILRNRFRRPGVYLNYREGMQVEDFLEEFKKIDPRRGRYHSWSGVERIAGYLFGAPYALYVLAGGDAKIERAKMNRSRGDTEISYPNPFNPECWIPINIQSKKQNVKCKIYNILGQLVREIECSNLPITKSQISKSIYWDGKDSRELEVPRGVYFYEVAGENKRI
jgi:hypothetical protein